MNTEDLQTRKDDLRTRASLIRAVYLKKLTGSNVALADVCLFNDISFCVEATSKGGRKSPTPEPKPKSEGGHFEPSFDSRTGRVMDTDAEYKVLSAIAETLDVSYDGEIGGNLYLYTELSPCQSCNGVIQQFKEKFPNIKVHVFSDSPYLPEL